MLREEVIGPRGQRWTVDVPQSKTERARGLLGRDGLEPADGMLFERTRSVHTVGMRFPILAVFLGPIGTHRVQRVRRVVHMPPGRLALPRPGVRAVLELPAGTDVRAGDAILCRLPTAGSDARAPIV